MTTSVARLTASTPIPGTPADRASRISRPSFSLVPLPSPPVDSNANAAHANGGSLSFDALYEAHFDFVWRMARRLGVPEAAADDVVQDTFVVLHRRLGDYDGATPIRRWLAGIVNRVVSDHRRRYRRKDAPNVPHPEDSERALASSAPAPSAELEQSEAVRLLETLLAELDEAKREVLVLVQLEEMTVPEVAEHLGENVNTIYARLRAARREFDAAHARHLARSASLASHATMTTNDNANANARRTP